MFVSKKHVDEKLTKACVLYVKNDGDVDRLYKDAEYTQTVTIPELKEFAFLGLVLFVQGEDIGDYYTWPWRVQFWDDGGGYEYGEVTFVSDISSGQCIQSRAYTAEFEGLGE